MKYTSTRDDTKRYTFEEALFSGYAPDGGLFVPEQLPTNVLFPSTSASTSTKNKVLSEEWPRLGYIGLATEVLHPFLGDESIAKDELKSLLRDALTGFDTTDRNLVPVLPMISKQGNNSSSSSDKNVRCYVAELFHGPTYCFKVRTVRTKIQKRWCRRAMQYNTVLV